MTAFHYTRSFKLSLAKVETTQEKSGCSVHEIRQQAQQHLLSFALPFSPVFHGLSLWHICKLTLLNLTKAESELERLKNRKVHSKRVFANVGGAEAPWEA